MSRRAAARAAGSPGVTSRPVFPSRTSSRAPPASEATTGRPASIPSAITRPNGSAATDVWASTLAGLHERGDVVAEADEPDAPCQVGLRRPLPQAVRVGVVGREQGVADQERLGAGERGESVEQDVLALPLREPAEHAHHRAVAQVELVAETAGVGLGDLVEGGGVDPVVDDARLFLFPPGGHERLSGGLGVAHHAGREPVREGHDEPSVTGAEVLGREDVVEVPHERAAGEGRGEGAHDQGLLRVGEQDVRPSRPTGQPDGEPENGRSRREAGPAPVSSHLQDRAGPRQHLDGDVRRLQPGPEGAVAEQDHPPVRRVSPGEVEEEQLRSPQLGRVVHEEDAWGVEAARHRTPS